MGGTSRAPVRHQLVVHSPGSICVSGTAGRKGVVSSGEARRVSSLETRKLAGWRDGGDGTHGPCPHRVAAKPEGGSGQSAGQISLRTRACVAPTPDGLPVGTAAWTPSLGPPARSQIPRRSPWCCACRGGRGCSSAPPRVLCPPVPSPAPLQGSALASPWAEGDSDDSGTGVGWKETVPAGGGPGDRECHSDAPETGTED